MSEAMLEALPIASSPISEENDNTSQISTEKDDHDGNEEIDEELQEDIKQQLDEVTDHSEDDLMPDLRRAFDVFDPTTEGFIDARKLGRVMRSLKMKPTEAEVQDLIMAIDDDDNGSIEFDEFATMMASRLEEPEAKDELYDAFRCFDDDANGVITVDDLGMIFGKLGIHYSEDELEDMITVADKTGDSKVTFKEFQTLYRDDDL